MNGTVKWYNVRQGYGFIQGEDGKDAFVHKDDLPFLTVFLNSGEKVEYIRENTKKGLKATNLKFL